MLTLDTMNFILENTDIMSAFHIILLHLNFKQ